MKLGKVIGVVVISLGSQLIYAAEQNRSFLDPVITLTGGMAINADAGASETFAIGYSQLDYDADHETQVAGVFGVFLGTEFPVFTSWALQLGVSYYQTSAFEAEGTLAQGFNPDTTALYDYHYDIVSHQALVESKLLARWHQKYRPYISLGLGAAFNEAKDYTVDYPPSLAITPTYEDHTTTSFTYTVGLGLDVDIRKYLRLGVGYRFTDLGKVKLAKGEYDQFDPTSISETLEQSHLYTQEVLVQLTYLM